MAVSLDIKSATGTAGQVHLPSDVFEAPVNVALIHQVVVAQLAAARQGSHSTKTRAEVSGGGIKPWRQKGTGRARQGSRRAPQWTGGGIVHGPKPRSYAQRTPKKMIAAALRSVLSDRVADGRFFVVDAMVTGDVPSTREALAALAVVGEFRTALVVLHRDEDLTWLSLRNVPEVHAIAVDQLNVYDVVNNQIVVFTKAALEEYLERLGLEVDADVIAEAEAAAEDATTDEADDTAGTADVAEEPEVAEAADEPEAEDDADAEEGTK